MNMHQSLDEIKQTITKDVLWDYYKIHTNANTAQHFKISQNKLKQLVELYNIVKTKDYVKATKEQTCLERYGVKNPFQMESNIKRGDDNPSRKSEVIEKIVKTRNDNNSYKSAALKNKETRIRNSGSLKNSYSNGIKKQQETLINKFGNLDAAYKAQQETRLNTFREKYNVDNPYQLDSVKHKIMETSKQRYGTNYPNQNTNIIASIYNSKLEHFGADNFGNWQKGHITRIKNYGSLEESYKQGYEKQKQTMLNKYGYECLFLSPDMPTYTNKKNTKPNIVFANFLKRNKIDFIQEFVIENKSFDFKVNDTLIEINPTITHNSTFSIYKDNNPIDKEYHYKKTELAHKYGYKVINIWDWDDINKVLFLLKPLDTIYARKCEIREVSKSDAKKFINTYHLQNYANDCIRIGLYYNNDLVSIMTFGKPRFNSKYDYELIRYCYSKHIIGGAEKIFSYFIKNYKPKYIISYCDESKFSGNVYNKLGFEFKSKSISKHWYNMKTNQHILDSLLRQRGFDQLFGTNYGKGTSNSELMYSNGFVEIYDSGQATYIWHNENRIN